MYIAKKNGKCVEYDNQKIRNAVELANGRSNKRLTDDEILEVVNLVDIDIQSLEAEGRDIISVSDIHDRVIKHLKAYRVEVADEYAKYRNYKLRFNKTFMGVIESTKEILSNGDKENANKDSSLISTQKELISGIVSKSMSLDYELNEEWSKAHIEGAIQIHDLADYIFNSFNCCLFDMGSLLRGGFTINGIKKTEPNSIRTAISVMSDVILSASSQQFGK